MLALIRNLLLLAFAVAIVGCVNDKPPQLVDDPAAKHDSSMPWNEQTKWEREGQYSSMIGQEHPGHP